MDIDELIDDIEEDDADDILESIEIGAPWPRRLPIRSRRNGRRNRWSNRLKSMTPLMTRRTRSSSSNSLIRSSSKTPILE